MKMMGLWRYRGLIGLVWKHLMNKEPVLNFSLLADCYPTELHRSEPQGHPAHSSLTVASSE